MTPRALALASAILVLTVGCGTPDGANDADTAPAPTARADTTGPGLVVRDSPHSVDSTMARLERAVEGAEPLSIMSRVDHAANAETVNRSLRPTRLLIFGNPELGTPLMEAGPTTGIDLPQKMLVWRDSTGQVRLAYNDPQYLAERHDVTGREEALRTIGRALRTLARRATASEQ